MSQISKASQSSESDTDFIGISYKVNKNNKIKHLRVFLRRLDYQSSQLKTN